MDWQKAKASLRYQLSHKPDSQRGLLHLRFRLIETATLCFHNRASTPGRIGNIVKFEKAARGRILLVDDSPDVLEVFSLCLEEAGYQVSKTWDSAKAFSMVQRAPPDAIIMDFWMPQLNGLELAALIKADANLATIPIGLITAAASILPSLITSHFLTVLTKPAALEDLVLMAEALIAARYATRRPEPSPLSL